MGNELGGWDGPAPPADWTIEMSTYIKSLAPNTLVSDGTLGGLNLPSRLSSSVLNSPVVDIFSNHYYYGQSDIERLKSDAAHVSSYGKAFFNGEFGLSDTSVYEELYKTAVATPAVSGTMIWSLRFHSRDGGMYVHSETDTIFSYHMPGFTYRPRFNSRDERNVVVMTRQYALQIAGLSSSTAYPVPKAPIAITGVGMTSRNIRFRGTPWAYRYLIFRRVSGGSWTQMALLDDGIPSGAVMYSEKNSVPSGGFEYKIQPFGIRSSGSWSSSQPYTVDSTPGPSLVIGPFYS